MGLGRLRIALACLVINGHGMATVSHTDYMDHAQPSRLPDDSGHDAVFAGIPRTLTSGVRPWSGVDAASIWTGQWLAVLAIRPTISCDTGGDGWPGCRSPGG